jgi:hypothetical protein
VRTDKYTKLSGKNYCGEHQHVTNTKYPQARDWSVKTRDERYFIIKPKNVYWWPKEKCRPHQALPRDGGKGVYNKIKA